MPGLSGVGAGAYPEAGRLRDRDKRIAKILHQPEDAVRGAFAHFLHKEIHEQPSALDRSIDRCADGSTR